jgi:replicative DNA helicase
VKNKMPKEGTEEFFKWQAEMESLAGVAEVIIGKQRHGPTGTVKVQFDADVTRFGNLARTDHLPVQMGE